MVLEKLPAPIALTIAVSISIVLLALLTLGVSGSPDDNIRETLVGMNLTYTNIAGMPMNYTITEESIGAIDKTTYKNQTAWKVHIGEGIAWDLTMNADGTRILDVKQLFYT